MKSEPMCDEAAIVIVEPLEELALVTPDNTIDLESCDELEWIVVTTRSSVYDVIVLSGREGEVMIRGGRLFPEFRRAILTGSLLGRSAIKSRSICVGMHLEFRVDDKSFVTSRMQAVTRHRVALPEARA